MAKFEKDVKILWKDKKRHFGMPISFTEYYLLEKPSKWLKLVEISGLLHTNVEEVLLFRVDDLGIYESMFQKLYGVGTVNVYVRDASCNVLSLMNIKNPMQVKNLISEKVDEDRQRRGVRYSELAM